MKKLFPIFGLALLSACGHKESTETSGVITLENPSFTTDTIAVNVGDEIFNANDYYGFDLSEDASTVYSMTLVDRHPFERDGPNRVPDFVNYFQALPNEEFLLSNSNSSGIYSLSGELVRKLDLTTESVSGFDFEKSGFLTNTIHLSADKSKAISLPKAFTGGISGLGIINLESMKGETLAIPEMKITEKYRVTFREGGSSASSGDFEEIQEVNGDFIIHSSATSDSYIFDPILDSLRLLTFPHQLVPRFKTGDFQTEVDSRERMSEVSMEMHKLIDFGRFYWDEENGRYLRFAIRNGDYFVFVYSEDFELQAEGKFEGFISIYNKSFVKEGKLYSYITVEENPGFLVYDFNF